MQIGKRLVLFVILSLVQRNLYPEILVTNLDFDYVLGFACA